MSINRQKTDGRETVKKPFLLFPGRHLVNTTFQAEYLKRINPKNVVYAITSSNQENSRYNPIPFYMRAVGVDRFAGELKAETGMGYQIFPIPHYGHTQNFAEFTIREIEHQSEGRIRLTPKNCEVLCSTPEVTALYEAMGFRVWPAEAGEPTRPVTPIQVITQVAHSKGTRWPAAMAYSHQALFSEVLSIPAKIRRLYQDPLTTQDGGLTDTRNYSTYARGMNEIIRLKYQDIRAGIKPGRIVDEGCADGALLTEISQDFPDSDLFGIDLSSEFASRFQERQRAGEFHGCYVHFFHRNLMDSIFEAGSITTTICNSTLHELWSYGNGAETVRAYLKEKFRQLEPGGRLVIRDVVGPERKDEPVEMWCNTTDGATPSKKELASQRRSKEWLESLSTYGRFLVFARDFKPHGIKYSTPEKLPRSTMVRVSLQTAAEFISKKDYTDNWESEMHEEFCFWSFSEWKTELQTAGFSLQEGSHAFTNPWTVENRYEKRVKITKGGKPTGWPPTNMVVIAEKPLEARTA